MKRRNFPWNMAISSGGLIFRFSPPLRRICHGVDRGIRGQAKFNCPGHFPNFLSVRAALGCLRANELSRCHKTILRNSRPILSPFRETEEIRLKNENCTDQ